MIFIKSSKSRLKLLMPLLLIKVFEYEYKFIFKKKLIVKFTNIIINKTSNTFLEIIKKLNFFFKKIIFKIIDKFIKITYIKLVSLDKARNNITTKLLMYFSLRE